jgi:hypothetical protein
MAFAHNVYCDTSISELADPCLVEGSEACTSLGDARLVCKQGRMRSAGRCARATRCAVRGQKAECR